ncbi:uncharacterized protein A4U43_C05F31300 [Asparagus officinalis]|uniref:Uncharacterized protein n=1 Tax=Asparagus officinalis TaxID=4686 RepID=A0A5P1F193_ASPOF|nr:uncharacterized protein LOC109843551 [Asparagus officinalis]ONK70200.1 uncharacterized protein A4U43_C05F31300 [Asparagus officinalis]
MGCCFSFSTSKAAASPPTTAIVIATDGSLTEHSVPVTASKALGIDHLTRFLCNSDSLSFENSVPPLNPHDLLEEDQIYFALPKSKLGCPLTGEDMAALAVKASAAMALASRRSGRKRREIRVSPAPVANEATAARMARQRSVKEKIGRRRSASMWAKAVRRSLRRTLSTVEEGDE